MTNDESLGSLMARLRLGQLKADDLPDTMRAALDAARPLLEKKETLPGLYEGLLGCLRSRRDAPPRPEPRAAKPAKRKKWALERAAQKMQADLDAGRLTPEALEGMEPKELTKYGASKNTALKAREKVLNPK
jgi:hypothetical protein